MKKKAFVHFCDYCGKESWTVCGKCGLDLCSDHLNYSQLRLPNFFVDIHVCKKCSPQIEQQIIELVKQWKPNIVKGRTRSLMMGI